MAFICFYLSTIIMPTLSDRDIRKYLRKGLLEITPLEDEQIGPASIDLTLANEWWFFRSSYLKQTVDLKKIGFDTAMKKTQAKTITLKPGQMCLGKTLEKIKMPSNILGKLEGRSRYARMGLSVHITSALVQPGSNNHQILEIVNFAPFSVTLHAGMRISQIIFHELNQETSKPYARYGKLAKKQ